MKVYNEHLSVKEASRILKMGEQKLRILMQRKEIDIGFAVKQGKGKYDYLISKKLVLDLEKKLYGN